MLINVIGNIFGACAQSGTRSTRFHQKFEKFCNSSYGVTTKDVKILKSYNENIKLIHLLILTFFPLKLDWKSYVLEK